ncbi:LacI family DNA-binding transcriptional regulator [Mesorhizobium sp. B4-1-4]|uniref:LacI family DNA-binding transcriptional regulator n=1 Tax=Mesorhizobium sp. B4-1-4 TaxID=2589888 RepID=UPI001127611C|nr:LacI family DNA-binding transcriptional regulator [Mesorhizobium sp. B4-1-4]UCI32088.1 LacI family DNA-binding transcriptional regulator [Mesorhizobium sp. B4-1-4]
MVGRKATFADVATAAGVSVGTVDRVINARGSVRAATEELVLKCARELQLDRALHLRPTRLLRLGVLLLNRTDPFLEDLIKGFQTSASDYSYLNIQVKLYLYGQLDPRVIAAKIVAVGRACDGLAVNVIDDPLVRTCLAEVAAKKPVFTLVSDLPDIGRIAYIGANGGAEGRVAGELMGRFVGPQGGQVLLISGPESFHGHKERELGFRSVLGKRFPNCVVVGAIKTFEDKKVTWRQTRSALKEIPGVVGIYNTSVGSDEIASALTETGREHSTTFITHELTETNRLLLQHGILDAIIDQDPFSEASMAIQRFLSFYGRLDVKHMETPFRIYLRESCYS